MVDREKWDGLSKHAPSFAFTHSRIGQIFIESAPRCPFDFFAAERGAGEWDAGRLSTCPPGLLPARPGFSRPRVLKPADPAAGPVSAGALIPPSPRFCLHSPPLRAAYKHHVPVFIWNYSTVKCSSLANCDTRECGNLHAFVYSQIRVEQLRPYHYEGFLKLSLHKGRGQGQRSFSQLKVTILVRATALGLQLHCLLAWSSKLLISLCFLIKRQRG